MQYKESLFNDYNNELPYFYITGNSGRGKSQLARQVCEKLYTENVADNITFMMTLNAQDVTSLLKDYAEFGADWALRNMILIIF